MVGGVHQNVVPHEVLDRVAQRLDWDAAHQVVGDVLGNSEAYRAANGHLACGLPRNSPHVHPEIVCNPIMEQVKQSSGTTHAGCGADRGSCCCCDKPVVLEQLVVTCLGGAAFMRYYNGNTSLPGSEPQSLHMDGGGWSVESAEEADAANLPWPHEGLKLFCNFSCDDMVSPTAVRLSTLLPHIHKRVVATFQPRAVYTRMAASLVQVPSNGSTECWLGSHLETTASQSRSPGGPSLEDLAELRRENHPPVQITVPKGAVAFRDLRVWHKGMPNSSDLPRHMISLGYGAERDPTAECSHLGAGKHKHLFGKDAKPAFVRPYGKPALVDTLASFVDGAVDHFGNPDPEGPSHIPRDDKGVALSGPYKGRDFSGGRFQYWLPKDSEPVPLDMVPKHRAEALPAWVKAVAKGESLPRRSHWSSIEFNERQPVVHTPPRPAL